MTAQLPSWPTTPPTYGSVVLRAFRDEDAHLAVELGEDPYIPLIGSLPAHPTAQQALEWIHRQRGQLAERQRYSFAIADAESDNAVGAIGLGLRDLSAARATAGYAVSPLHRGRGIAQPPRPAGASRADDQGRARVAPGDAQQRPGPERPASPI
jgi:[ribosomal protein S5]-alanine N-acetyltransferase